ncbi:MAG: hypothetical protein AAF206_20900 [Bacteroidota bacterium]
MKLHLLLSLLLLLACQANSQNRIHINIPTAEAETEYIWQNIRDIQFFEQHGYQLSLPQGPLMEELKQKAKASRLSDEDYARLKRFVAEKVYRKADYQTGFDKIHQQLELINKMVNQLKPAEFPWGFASFETYQVNLTLYGPGGSYNPDEGSILLYTTPDGRFKNYDNPANTIIHEIVHIGIEADIIGQYNVPHPLKERIVDTFVSLYFGQDLPDYRIQNMGETRSDQYLKKKDDVKKLEQIVQGILKE